MSDLATSLWDLLFREGPMSVKRLRELHGWDADDVHQAIDEQPDWFGYQWGLHSIRLADGKLADYPHPWSRLVQRSARQ